MNIFLTHLSLDSTVVHRNDVLSLVSGWYGRKVHADLDLDELLSAGTLHAQHDGHTVRGVTSGGSAPRFISFRLTHPDWKVAQRGWITDTTLTFNGDGTACAVSVHLHTVESGAFVAAPPTTTRPRLVVDLVDRFGTASTPGRDLEWLGNDPESVDRFRARLESDDRTYPLVVISQRDSGPLIDIRRTAANLKGTAQVVGIERGADTRALAQVLGTENVPYAGAVFILPGDRRFTRRGLLPYLLAEDRSRGVDLEARLFAEVVSRTNVLNLRRHVPPQRVQEERLRFQISDLVDRSTAAEELERVKALYEEQLEKVHEDLAEAKTSSDGHLQDALAELEKNDELREEIFTLKARIASADQGSSPALSVPAERDLLARVLNSRRARPTLEEVLNSVEALFPDRVIVLPSAKRSAQDSRFVETDVALDLLVTLCSEAFCEYATGNGDAGVRALFGRDAFASDESETVKSRRPARRRRTFTYRGEERYMGRHLKHGVKESDVATLRIHYDWDAERQRLVIGHCGEHLDFF